MASITTEFDLHLFLIHADFTIDARETSSKQKTRNLFTILYMTYGNILVTSRNVVANEAIKTGVHGDGKNVRTNKNGMV